MARRASRPATFATRVAQGRRARLARGWLRRQWSALLVAVLVLVAGFAAFINQGVEATDLRLNEGAVYVQNQNRAMVGNLNYQIDQISAATTVGDTASTLLQEGRTVLVNNAGSSTLQVYDPATNTLSTPTTPPAQALLSLNSGVLAVTNPENGKVWFGPVDEVARSDFKGRANLDLLDWGQAVVTTSGEVIGLNVQDSTIVRPDGTVVEVPFQVDNSAPTAQLSAVGGRAVVLDRVSQQIWVEGEREAVTISSGSTAELAPPMADQRPAGRGGSVVYATLAGLNTIVGGAPRSLSGLMEAAPTRPVTVGECAYGAFTTRVVKVCAGGEPQVQDIPVLPSAADLVFQVNRGNVVLQDALSGKVWLVDKGMKIVDNWEEVTPEAETRADDPNPPDDRVTLPDRSQPNRPPVAQDDPELGARAGRSTVLPILDNDSDEDGDIITVTEVSDLTGGPSLEFTGNGAGLQITMPEDASGAHQFSYTITDGRGGTDSATATVQALPADQAVSNRPPVNIRPGETLALTSGTTATKRVLLTWRDPDGDDLVLVNAMPETLDSEDEVTFAPDGTITFRDVGKTTGPKRVRVWVSDGASTVEGFLMLDVRSREVAAPIANGDFVSTVVNREVVVSPLLNDEGNNLMLTEVEQSTGEFTVTPNYPEGTFRFRAGTPGTYYVVYKVNNGAVSAGLVRIDVAPVRTENHAPVAVRDTALVPFGGSVVIDPLLNDTDADNDVLVVQSISQHDAVKVIMQERHLLTVSMVTQTDTPVALTYWVSDGRNSTRGTIVVFPAPHTGNSAPRAVNDQVRVRAGTTVSVPVLANDVSPVGLPLTIAGLPGRSDDTAWIDGERLRVSVPASTPASTIPLTYEVSDGSHTDSATVFITVISADAQNEAPIPGLVEARVLSNSVTRIPVRLSGVDPNGDSVRLLGLGSGPALGRVVEIGDGWLRYEAYPDSRGTDTFRYQVIDALGAVGTGEIRIGVAPPSDDNTGPIGVPDEITVQPGRSVTLPVLVNDYDIDGDQFGFRDEDAIEMDFPARVVDGQYIAMTAPREPGDYLGTYYLIDRRGTPGQGTVFLHVDADAPLAPPTAVDDQLAVNDVLNQEWVELDVLANDFDIDGAHDELVVSLPEPDPGDPVEASVVDRKLSVKVSDKMQQVRYLVTDADGNRAQAVAQIPGRNDSVPVLADPAAPNTVEAGQVLTINFDTMVLGTQNRHVRLTSPDTVRATKGTVSIRPDGIDFQADVRYAGPASVVFEVIDDTDPSDKSAKRAFITVSITVTPAPQGPGRNQNADEVSNRAPEGPANISLDVGAGEPDQQFPLRGRFTDPEGDNFSFQSWTLASGGNGVEWSASVGGDVIVARGGLTSKGEQAVLSGRVVDVYGASREVTVTITVTGSTRPLPVAQTDVVDDANAGQSRTVDVLANDRSYLVDDQKLSVLSAAVVSGAGTAEVAGDSVRVTPADDYVGLMNVRYTIVDATNDSARQVDGAIQLTVRSRPSTPGTPTIEEAGDKQVTIKWTSNSSNGLPVTERLVVATGANGSVVSFSQCATNTCTVTGLTNNVGYTFVVSEANELGPSDPSNPSAVGTPDVRPPQLAPPTLVFPGPGQPGRLDLSWAPPQFDGSPITEYTITSVDGSVPAVTLPGGTTSHVFSGLTNYKGYQFVITATNNAGTSDPSAPSNPEHPSGPPPEAPAPSVSDTADMMGQTLRVTWSVPPEQADPFRVSLVAIGGGGEVVVPVEAGQNVTDITGLRSRSSYQVLVRIETRGGTTDSPLSAPVTTTAAPQQAAPGTLTASAPDQLTFQLAGNAELDWDYASVTLVHNGTPVHNVPNVAPGGVVPFVAGQYDGAYTVQTQAFAKAATGDKGGATWGSDPVRAYGTPQVVDARQVGTADGNVVLLDTGRVQPNGTDTHTFAYSVNGGAFTAYQAGEVLEIATNGARTNVRLQVCDAARPGNCGTTPAIALAPPMTASASGATLSITMNDTSARNWRCLISDVVWTGSVDGGTTKTFTLDPKPTGARTVTCSAVGIQHSVGVNFGA